MSVQEYLVKERERGAPVCAECMRSGCRDTPRLLAAVDAPPPSPRPPTAPTGGLRLRIQGLGFGGLGFGVYGVGLGIQDSGFKV